MFWQNAWLIEAQGLGHKTKELQPQVDSTGKNRNQFPTNVAVYTFTAYPAPGVPPRQKDYQINLSNMFFR